MRTVVGKDFEILCEPENPLEVALLSLLKSTESEPRGRVLDKILELCAAHKVAIRREHIYLERNKAGAGFYKAEIKVIDGQAVKLIGIEYRVSSLEWGKPGKPCCGQ